MPDPATPPLASLVALRDRREVVIASLSDHYAADLLDVDELDRRIDLAHQARTVADLDALLADLVVTPTTALVTRPGGAMVGSDDGRSSKRRMFAIFGGFEKKGRWKVPKRLSVIAVFGGAELDFREADFAPGVSELHIVAVMGGLELIVPPNLAVECEASAIMGGFEEIHRVSGEPDPDRPVLRITGLAVMGGVSIATRLVGETSGQARKRHKRERKALAAAHTRSLPPGSDD